MIEYRILKAQLADWERVRSIRLRSLSDSPDAFGTTLAEEQQRTSREWRERIANNRVTHFLAATSDEDDVGLAVGAPYTGHEETAGLFGMWVAPEVRKQGIGVALVQAVLKWAENEKHRRIILDVAKANTNAIRLYRSCGFVPTGKTGTLPPPRDHIREFEFERILH